MRWAGPLKNIVNQEKGRLEGFGIFPAQNMPVYLILKRSLFVTYFIW